MGSQSTLFKDSPLRSGLTSTPSPRGSPRPTEQIPWTLHHAASSRCDFHGQRVDLAHIRSATPRGTATSPRMPGPSAVSSKLGCLTFREQEVERGSFKHKLGRKPQNRVLASQEPLLLWMAVPDP